MDNYENNNNYNYADENYNYGSYENQSYSYDYNNYDNQYQMPTGMAGLKTIALNKVVAKSFLFMFVALLITAFASLTTSFDTAKSMVEGGTFYIVVIAELAIVFAGNYALKKNNAVLACVLYTAYSFMTGMMLSVIFWVYKLGSIMSIFFIAAALFAIMAVVGLVTKKDLTKLGSICIMALLGVIIASIVGAIIGGSDRVGLEIAKSVIVVIIFVGLTAYDTQRIKQMVAYSTDKTENSLALFGAFQLYLDFINLFIRLLSLFGKRK